MCYRGCGHFRIYKEYETKVESNWDLAEKASTIEQKSEYIDKYVASIDTNKLKGTYNAIFFPTPSNSFDENFKAVQSLQKRLKEISTMDVESFAYQTAIQQITQQEQAEAKEANGVTSVISGCWEKANYYYYWNPWFCISMVVLQIIMLVVGISKIDN